MNIITVKQHSILLDDEDYDLYKDSVIRVFFIGTKYYAKFKDRYLHRLILKVNDPRHIVDHINGNGLDNRRGNLRICSKKENTRNNKGLNTYKGVDYDKRLKTKPFNAIITVNCKKMHLGSFSTEKEAAKAYNNAAIQYFGEFAKLNKIED